MTRKRKRRRRGRGGLLVLLLAALLALRLWYDNFTVGAPEYTVAAAEIPQAFDGFRISVVSDLHGNRRLYSALVNAVAEAEPDIIALTGDLCDREDQWPELEPLLKSLTALAPVYYVSGNHEWADLAAEPFFDKLAQAGVTLLRNDWTLLEKGGASLLLAGVEDPNGYADMLTPAELAEGIRQAAPDAFSILLSHRPGRFPAYAELGFRLTLSGHNHGGLVRLPILGGLVSPGGWLPRYDRGLFTLGDCRMIVSGGLSGSMGVPRLFNRPEAPVIILGKR